MEGLTKHQVQTADQISSILDQGNKNRTIASTLMNQTSSRAHTIITIFINQYEILLGKKVEKFSQINLVDLAGSEKFSKTNA